MPWRRLGSVGNPQISSKDRLRTFDWLPGGPVPRLARSTAVHLRPFNRTTPDATMTLPSTSSPISAHAAAELLAIVVAANGSIDASELAELERLGAFERLRLPRAKFMRLADAALNDIGLVLSRRRWLGSRERARMLALQLQVRDRAEQLTIARLAAAVITADGRVTPDERQVYGALLSAWGLSHGMVTHAIMTERLH